MMKNNLHLIFDFDGTMVDSFDVVIKKFNLLAGEFNFRYIDDHEIDIPVAPEGANYAGCII